MTAWMHAELTPHDKSVHVQGMSCSGNKAVGDLEADATMYRNLFGMALAGGVAMTLDPAWKRRTPHSTIAGHTETPAPLTGHNYLYNSHIS